MPYLIAQGQRPQDRWRRSLPTNRKLILGRSAGLWSTSWDEKISRQHIEMTWCNSRLEVTRIGGSRNPVFYRGHDVQHVLLKPDEHFVIGETTFTLVDDKVEFSIDDPAPMTEQHFTSQDLRQVPFRDADRRIDVLGRLPDIIQGAANDSELSIRLVNLLLTGIPRASAVAIICSEPTQQASAAVRVLHWDRRLLTGDNFSPSQRLIRETLRRGESVVHTWVDTSERQPHFTQSENIDWAFCSPVPGSTCAGWAIYVEGQFSTHVPSTPHASDPYDVRDDLKFTELAAATLSSLRHMRQLEHSQASLRQFFSPSVLDALAEEDPDVVLAPLETTVSVLFCDLRGFSRTSEESADDLLELLHRVSDALGVTTRHILEQGGVVGDFHGDAAMGFWGWPLATDDSVERACQAAMNIRADFETAGEHDSNPLRGFRIGIGIATGKAVAGKIGTVDQVKVTVFGPVVNLASRLEGMTKVFRAPILIDQQTAELIRQHIPSEQARVRRIAVVRPYGMASTVEVSELLPPSSKYELLSDEHIAFYEQALDALLAGDWSQAFDLLHHIPAEDRVKDFLTVYIAQHNRMAPAGWDGVIPISSK